MATETLAATGGGSPYDWLAYGSTALTAVALPDDDAGSYIDNDAVDDCVMTYTTSPVSLTSGAVVSQVQVVARVIRGESNRGFAIGYYFTLQGGGTQSGESSGLSTNNSWTTNTYTHSGLSAVYGSDFTFWIRNNTPHQMKCTTLYAVVTFTPADGHPAVARARLVPGMRRPHGSQGW